MKSLLASVCGLAMVFALNGCSVGMQGSVFGHGHHQRHHNVQHHQVKHVVHKHEGRVGNVKRVEKTDRVVETRKVEPGK